MKHYIAESGLGKRKAYNNTALGRYNTLKTQAMDIYIP